MKMWLSTKDAMKMLGVGSTTIKRWADEGLLNSSRTAGGHRRFQRSDVIRLANSTPERDLALPEVDIWVRRLTSSDYDDNLTQQIHALCSRLGSWYETADFLGRVLTEVGNGWANGTISVIEEHIASNRLRLAVGALAESMIVPDEAPICRLATLSGETHELGLFFARLCFRASGIETTFIGADTPADDLVRFIHENEQSVIGLSASAWLTDYGTLNQAVLKIAAACRTTGTELILGGEGAWPDELDYGHHCARFVELPGILRSIS